MGYLKIIIYRIKNLKPQNIHVQIQKFRKELFALGNLFLDMHIFLYIHSFAHYQPPCTSRIYGAIYIKRYSKEIRPHKSTNSAP